MYLEKYRPTYAVLQDDISKIAFEQRLKYYYDCDRKIIYDMFEMLEPMDKTFRQTINRKEPLYSIFDMIRLYRKNPKTIVLYGCGGASKMPITLLEHYNIRANFYCDKNSALQGLQHNGLLVLSPQELVNKYSDSYIVTATFEHAESMNLYLQDIGFNENQIFYSQFFPEQMYFGFPFFDFSDTEYYLDCGVSNGETIKAFSDRVHGKYTKVKAFEPDPKCYERSLNYIRALNLQNVDLLNCGVYSKSDELFFFSTTDGSAHIGDNGETSVKVCKIDDVVGDDVVTFIKMDIEGSEFEALRGAEKTIRRCKPKLAICLYHKPEDIPLIPSFINSIVPEYKIWIRPYEVGFKEAGDVHLGETILYACI